MAQLQAVQVVTRELKRKAEMGLLKFRNPLGMVLSVVRYGQELPGACTLAMLVHQYLSHDSFIILSEITRFTLDSLESSIDDMFFVADINNSNTVSPSEFFSVGHFN